MTTKAIFRSLKNTVYGPPQIAVRECTCNDPSTPTEAQLSHVSDLTYSGSSFHFVMSVLAKRLKYKDKNWRHVDKSLYLLDYLVRHGSEAVILWCAKNIDLLKKLTTCDVKDEFGYDHGISIRYKATEIISLVSDGSRLKEERRQAKIGILRRNQKLLEMAKNGNTDVSNDELDETLGQYVQLTLSHENSSSMIMI